LRARFGETSFYHVNKKRRKEWKEVKEAQERATANALFVQREQADLAREAAFDTPGLSLKGIRQKEAHRAIRQVMVRRTPERRQTAANIAQIKAELKTYCGWAPTTAQIWRGIRSPDFSRKVRNFFWKAIHGALKIGAYFLKMPEPWRSKANCPTCGVVESLEHILLDCPDSKQHIIWGLVAEVFKKK
ncbi:hypothetical protein AURDEDRAFT_25414, partial [Auricularia subglabra TFB-10046 SS5]